MPASSCRSRALAAAAAALALLAACAGPPAEIREALETQSKWTRLYVEYANALIEKEGKTATLSDGERHEKKDMLGVGHWLVRNAEAFVGWARGKDLTAAERR